MKTSIRAALPLMLFIVAACCAVGLALFPEMGEALGLVGGPLALASVAMPLAAFPGARKDPFGPQNERMARIRVNIAPQNGTDIMGQHVPHGVHELVVYASDLDRIGEGPRGQAIRSRVRTPRDIALYETAKETNESAFAAWRKENAGSDPKKFPGSPEFEFCRMNGGRGVPPIISLEVLDADLPPPETPENSAGRQNEALIKMLTDALRGGNGSHAPDAKEMIELRAKAAKADALEARLADLERLVSQLAPAKSAEPTTPERPKR